jgi:hypothetical protein
MLLLRKDFSGVNESLLRLLSNDIFDEEQKGTVRSLQTYLSNNRERLNYREHVWRKQRAEKMTVICAAIYSKQGIIVGKYKNTPNKFYTPIQNLAETTTKTIAIR